jgi:hypothetical protein
MVRPVLPEFTFNQTGGRSPDNRLVKLEKWVGGALQRLSEALLEWRRLWGWRWFLLGGPPEMNIGIKIHTVHFIRNCQLIPLMKGSDISDAPLESLSYEQLKERLAFLKQLEEQNKK